MTNDRDRRRDYHRAQSVAAYVAADELDVPVLVESVAMSRTRTESDPPYMTSQAAIRELTLRRKQMERELAEVTGHVKDITAHVHSLQKASAVAEVHLAAVRTSLGEFESIATFRELVMMRLTDVSGNDGTNGKLGALKARFDLTEARRWWVITFLAGLSAATLSTVFWAGSTVATLRANYDNLRELVIQNRADIRANTHQAKDSL